MRNISDGLSDRDRVRKVMMPFWVFFILYMLTCIALTHLVTAVALSKDHVYESSVHIAGLPLISYNPVAHGIIALGGRATGVIALGGVAVGLIAIGGLSVGVFAVGGVSIGVIALAGLAVGWRAMGGVAFGRAALGPLAIGKHAYAGNGIAFGSAEASGRQKEKLIR
jgi:hypothetical protein